MTKRIRVVMGAAAGVVVATVLILTTIALLVSIGGPWAWVFIFVPPFELLFIALLHRDWRHERARTR